VTLGLVGLLAWLILMLVFAMLNWGDPAASGPALVIENRTATRVSVLSPATDRDGMPARQQVLWTVDPHSTLEVPGVCDAIGVEAHEHLANPDVEPRFDEGQFGERIGIYTDTSSCVWVIGP
jgi:hypothetical protein